MELNPMRDINNSIPFTSIADFDEIPKITMAGWLLHFQRLSSHYMIGLVGYIWLLPWRFSSLRISIKLLW